MATEEQKELVRNELNQIRQGGTDGTLDVARQQLQEIREAGGKIDTPDLDRGKLSKLKGFGVGLAKQLGETLRPSVFAVRPGVTGLAKPLAPEEEVFEAVTPAERVGKIFGTVAELALGTGLVTRTVKTLRAAKQKVAQEFDTAILGKPREEIIPIQTRQEIKAGIRPDLKKRISGKAEDLSRFFKQATARNLDDTEKSPLGLAGEDVSEAFRKLGREISDTGSEIGKFRKKISTIKVPTESFVVDKKTTLGIESVLKNMDKTLERKGLILGKNRQLKKSGTRETIFSDREIFELQKMRDMLIRLKGDPTVLRVIDNRNIIQKNIDFAKEAREISNSIDPVSKGVRSDLARLNRQAIGKSESKKLEEFSELIDLVEEFKRLTSKGRNTEFILKRLLSERDRAPKEVVERIKEITGIDIMDSAQFSRLATEILGNEQQKGLFRQEIANAGIDISELFTRTKAGTTLKFLTEIGKKGKEELLLRKGIDPKLQEAIELAKTFLEAAK